jgi:hypothetical protein
MAIAATPYVVGLYVVLADEHLTYSIVGYETVGYEPVAIIVT